MAPQWLWRALSHLWPITVAKVPSRMGMLEISWENGRKVLNSQNGNQSYGSLHQVWVRTFAALDLPALGLEPVLMLGLGAGSVVHILREELALDTAITVVERDPAMVELADLEFNLNKHSKVTIIQGDALVQLHAFRTRFGLILVDLFNDLDMALGIDTNGFAHALRDRCSDEGMVLFNTVAYDEASSLRCDRVLSNLKKAFGTVKEFRFEGVNRVFVAS